MTVSNIQIPTNWEEYGSIKKWKNSLKYNSYKNRLSPKTYQAMKNWMPLFIEFAEKTPDDIIPEADVENGKDIVKARLSNFCTWLEDVKEKTHKTSVHGAYHIIRGFYSHNNINTQKIRTPKIEPSEVQFTDDNLPLFDIIEVEKSDGIKKKEKRIKRDLIKNFLDCLSPRDKIICMCLKDSGLDISDLLDLPLKTVRYQDNSSERIFIKSQRNKTGEILATFFTKETTKLVKNYVQLHRKNADDNEPIFVQSNHEFKISFHKKNNRKFDSAIDELKPESVDPHYLSKSFRIATEKLEKLLSTNENRFRILQREKQSPLRPKRFRKLFNAVCDEVGIPVDIKRVFMGKSDPSNKVYGSKSRQDLELFFEKIEPSLMIYSEPQNESDLLELKKIKDDYTQLQKEFQQFKNKGSNESTNENYFLSQMLKNGTKKDYERFLKLFLENKEN